MTPATIVTYAPHLWAVVFLALCAGWRYRQWLHMKLILARLAFTYPVVAKQARLVFVTVGLDGYCTTRSERNGVWGAIATAHAAYALSHSHGKSNIKSIEYRDANRRRIPS